MPVFDFEDTQRRDEVILVDINNKRDFYRNDASGTRNFTWTKDGFFDTTSGWKNRHIGHNIGDVSAQSGKSFPLLRFPTDITITAVELGVDTTVGVDATNYETLTLYSSGRSTAMATGKSTAAGLTLATPSAFAGITSTTGKLAAGDTMYVTFADTLSGKALSAVSLHITFTIDRPTAVSGDQEDNFVQIINGEAGADGLIESDHLLRDHIIQKRNGEICRRIDINGIMYPGKTYTPPDMYYIAAANVGTIASGDSGGTKKISFLFPSSTVKIEKIYFGADTAALADSETAFMEILIVDNSDNKLTSGFVHGPAGAGQALVAGRLYEMEAPDSQYAELTSSEWLEIQFLALGSPANIVGLTIIVIYRKID